MRRVQVRGPCIVVEITLPDGKVIGGHFQFDKQADDFLADHPNRDPAGVIRRRVQPGQTWAYIAEGRLIFPMMDQYNDDLKRMGTTE